MPDIDIRQYTRIAVNRQAYYNDQMNIWGDRIREIRLVSAWTSLATRIGIEAAITAATMGAARAITAGSQSAWGATQLGRMGRLGAAIASYPEVAGNVIASTMVNGARGNWTGVFTGILGAGLGNVASGIVSLADATASGINAYAGGIDPSVTANATRRASRVDYRPMVAWAARGWPHYHENELKYAAEQYAPASAGWTLWQRAINAHRGLEQAARAALQQASSRR